MRSGGIAKPAPPSIPYEAGLDERLRNSPEYALGFKLKIERK